MAFPIDLTSKPRLRHIAVSRIAPNPYQPRKTFDREALDELTESIRRYGVITPLTVRREGDGYILIAGERRLRAARQAGLETVPCYIVSAGDEEMSVLALIENLQRRDLDVFEEAEGLLRLTRDFGLTQQQAAERVGKTQSAVANKLRLLKLAPEVIELMREHHLSERHGRALLSIPDAAIQLEAAKTIARRGMTVAQAEDYIARLLEAHPVPRRQGYIKDIRLFLNSLNRAVETVRRAGLGAELTREEKDGSMTLTIIVRGAVRAKQ